MIHRGVGQQIEEHCRRGLCPTHFFWQHMSCQRSEQISNGHPCNMSAIWNCLDTEVALSLVGPREEAARIRGRAATVSGNVAVEMVRTIKMGTWGSWFNQKHQVRHRVTPWTVGHCADAFNQTPGRPRCSDSFRMISRKNVLVATCSPCIHRDAQSAGNWARRCSR